MQEHLSTVYNIVGRSSTQEEYMRNGPKRKRSPRYIFRKVLRELRDISEVPLDHRVCRKEGKLSTRQASRLLGISHAHLLKGERYG